MGSAAPWLMSTLAILGLGCNAEVVRARAAADFRCPEGEVRMEELPGGAFRASGCGQTATFATSGGGAAPVYGPNGISGWVATPVSVIREADPPSLQTSVAAPQQPRADEGTGQLSASPFPKGAAGFRFGVPRTEAEAACLAVGEVAAVEDGDDLQCSKPASPIGFDASVELGFCDGAICRIDILTRPRRESGWVDRFIELRRALEERYGQPTAIKAVLPHSCHTRVSTCLSDGTAAFRITWKWSADRSIKLEMGKRSGGPVIRVKYERPVTGEEPLL